MSVESETSVEHIAVGASQFEALRETVDDGSVVDLDGLYATRGDADYDREGGYTFGTSDGEWTGLSESAFHERATDAPLFVANWYFWTHEVDGEGTHRRAFLRWLEGAPPEDAVEVAAESETAYTVPERYAALADGITRKWGQLRVSARLGENGTRRYEVRHEADVDLDREALEVHTDPQDAHALVKYDERGRYRPLKTAPTLPTGWAFADLDARALVETVDAIYPATVANWHLERQGRLDVSHWDETAERQTGIYDIVDELDREAVNRVAASCCVDSQCLRRREWDVDTETELDPPRGDGAFPCREPCSLVVAAARKWAVLEREESRTYEFELTPSEKEQVEAIVDAVADGRADEVREGDFSDGANRYRARYLREKRFDDEGRLSGTPTDPEAADADDSSDRD